MNIKNSKILMKTLIQQKVNSVQCQSEGRCVDAEGENSGAFKCRECEATFRTLVAKKKHEKFFHFFSKPYICDCGQQFGKLCEVNYHIRRVHNKERNYVCEVCNKAFFKHSDLVIHQNIHQASAKFICEDCGKRFKHVSNLNRHSRIHTGIKPYLCLPCNKRFSQISALRQHEITEKHKERVAEENKKKRESNLLTNGEDENAIDGNLDDDNSRTDLNNRKWWFYCKICGERFPFSVLLRDHETKHMANKDIRCNSCKAEFSHVKDFINHSCTSNPESPENKPENNGMADMKNAENQRTYTEPYLLNENEDTLVDKRVELTLSQNGQIMLDNDEVLLTLNDKVYGLLLINNDVTVMDNDDYLQLLNRSQDLFDESPDFPEMDNVFNMDNFQNEMSQTVDDGVERLALSENWLWNQEDCTQAKAEEGILAEETKQEEEKQTLNSTTLGTDADKTENVLKNTEVVENTVKTQKFNCPECDKGFSWNSSLRNHLIKKHAKKEEFPCCKCDKIYYSKLLVQHHIKRDHLNIRSFKCTFCGKSFFRRYDLKVHIRIHTDERPYICKVCGKRFRHLSHSIRHDRTHLKDSVQQQKGVDPLTGNKKSS